MGARSPEDGEAVVERLPGALLMEEDERWATMNKCHYGNACERLKLKEARLVEMARL